MLLIHNKTSEETLQELTRIEGNIVHITFSNEDTGFTVLELETQDEYVTVVGEMAGVGEGQKLIVFGNYTNHPSFGVQFKAHSVEVTLPSGVNAIYQYLSSGAVKGIGPVTAKRIVEAFGEDTFEIIDTSPEKLAEIKGLTFKKAVEIQNEFRRIYGIQDVIKFLAAYNIQAHYAIALYGYYGQNILEIINNNPYIMCGEPCFFDFDVVDEIAQKMSVEYDDYTRITGGIIYVMRHNTLKGHSCVPKDKLVSTVATFISVEPEKIQNCLNELCEQSLLINEEIEEKEFVFLTELYSAERVIAQRLFELISQDTKELTNVDTTVNAIQTIQNIKYAPLQIEALKKVAQSNVSIITGGPGTGKTTLVKGIISMFEMQGDRVFLCAPTGRAAKRLTELSQRPAKTIHRMLEVVPGSRDNIRFSKNKDNPLACEVLIVDEFSMVDVVLFSNLITAIKDGCRLVLVGDHNQLPAVGPGNILKDLLDGNIVPSVKLVDIFRQAKESDIIVNAHEINNGNIPKTSSKNGDYFFIESDGNNIAATITSLIKERLPKAYGFNWEEDIQVLCPSRKKRGGTTSINAALQQQLNPEKEGKPQLSFNGIVYRKGDKVMQIRNNYDLEYTRDDGEQDTGVFNGDIGTVIGVDKYNKTLLIRFDDKTYLYTQEDLPQLEHAWAITVHKSQGCEFKAVILSVADIANELQYRNLLYTAFTRAKDLLVVVGQPSILYKMVTNDRKQLRYSAVGYFLKEMCC